MGLNKELLRLEREHPERRIVRVWCKQPGHPSLFDGDFANAPVERGETDAIQWNDGEVIPIV